VVKGATNLKLSNVYVPHASCSQSASQCIEKGERLFEMPCKPFRQRREALEPYPEVANVLRQRSEVLLRLKPLIVAIAPGHLEHEPAMLVVRTRKRLPLVIGFKKASLARWAGFA
jgi:hypothetical protein